MPILLENKKLKSKNLDDKIDFFSYWINAEELDPEKAFIIESELQILIHPAFGGDESGTGFQDEGISACIKLERDRRNKIYKENSLASVVMDLGENTETIYSILRSEFLERTKAQIEAVAESSVGKSMKHVDFWMLAIKPPQLKNTEDRYEFSENGDEADTIDKIRVLTFRKELIKDAWNWMQMMSCKLGISSNQILEDLCTSDPKNEKHQLLTIKFKNFLAGESAIVEPNHVWRHFAYIAQAVKEFKEEKPEHKFMGFSVKVEDELMSQIGLKVYKTFSKLMGEDMAREFAKKDSLGVLMVLASQNMLKYLERPEIGKFYPKWNIIPKLGEKRYDYKAGETLKYVGENYNTKSLITALNKDGIPEIILAQKSFKGVPCWSMPGGFARETEIKDYDEKIGLRETVLRESVAEVLKISEKDSGYKDIHDKFMKSEKVYQGEVFDPRASTFLDLNNPTKKAKSIVSEVYFHVDLSSIKNLTLRNEGLETADIENISNARRITILDIYKKGYINKMYGSQAGVIDGFVREQLLRFYDKDEVIKNTSIFVKMSIEEISEIKGILIGRGIWKEKK